MWYHYILNWSYLIYISFFFIKKKWLHWDQGKGMLIVIGAGNKASVDINFLTLLLGRTINGCIFGGIKVQSDIPLLVNKCINKVSSFLWWMFHYSLKVISYIPTKIILFICEVLSHTSNAYSSLDSSAWVNTLKCIW